MTDSAWRTLALTMLLACLAYLAIHGTRRVRSGQVADFRAYYTAAAELRAGRDPYAPDEQPYLYPPLLAFLCMPLTSLAMGPAALAYLPVLLAATGLSLWLAPRALLERWSVMVSPTALGQVTVLLVLLLFDRLKSDIQMFQVNTLMLLLFTVGLYWLDRRPWLAGSALGLALNIKGQSIVMLPYLLWRRRWAAAAGMVGAALGFALLPAVGIGWSANLRNLSHLFSGLNNLTGGSAAEDSPTHLADVTAGFSISVTSGLARMLEGVGAGAWLWPAVGVLLMLLGVWVVRVYRQAEFPLAAWPSAAGQAQPPWRTVVGIEWVSVMLATLVFNPQTNTRHLVLTLLPMAMALAALCKPVPRLPWRIMLAGVALLFAALTLPPGSRRIGWLRDLHNAWFPIGGPSWLILLALGLMLWAGLRAVSGSRRA